MVALFGVEQEQVYPEECRLARREGAGCGGGTILRQRGLHLHRDEAPAQVLWKTEVFGYGLPSGASLTKSSQTSIFQVICIFLLDSHLDLYIIRYISEIQLCKIRNWDYYPRSKDSTLNKLFNIHNYFYITMQAQYTT